MTGQTIHYTYDPLYRLTAADYTDGRYFDYSYDAVGNRLSQESKSDPGGNPASSTYTYDQANRLTSVNGVSYSWDDNGDLLSDGTSSYEYDAFSHLTKVVDGSDTYEFSYDEQGNRVGQAMNGNWTYYDLDLNAGLTEVLTAQDEDYLYGLGPTPLAQIDPGDIDYLFTDGLGSVRQVVRGDSYGQVTLTESYDPFGNLLSSLGNSSSAFGYAGQWQDSYIKLIDMRARFYDSSDGRFITEDSWQGDQNQPMSYDKWLYVYANPINKTDRSGHSPDCDDEYQRADLTQWLINELNANRRSLIADFIRMNIQHWKETGGSEDSFPNGGDFLSMGLGGAAFYSVVQTHGLWDFKWKINHLIGPYVRIAGNWYRSDVPGNVHYGYIGLSVGFGKKTLHCGADFADNRKWCSGSDPQEDFEAIETGFDLLMLGGENDITESTLKIALSRHSLAKGVPMLPNLHPNPISFLKMPLPYPVGTFDDGTRSILFGN